MSGIIHQACIKKPRSGFIPERGFCLCGSEPVLSARLFGPDYCQAASLFVFIFFCRLISPISAHLLSADIELTIIDSYSFKELKGICRHAVGQVYRAVIFIYGDPADKLAADISFIGNGSDDIAWFYAMQLADLYPIAFHPFVGCATRPLLEPFFFSCFRGDRSFADCIRFCRGFSCFSSRKSGVFPCTM